MDPEAPNVKMTVLDGLTPIENVPATVEEGSPEEQRQVKGLYEDIQKLFFGIDHMVVAKTVGVYMATLMISTDRWKDIIPGFMNQMDMAANLAVHHHERKEHATQDSSKTDQSEAGSDEGNETPPGSDSDLEVKEG